MVHEVYRNPLRYGRPRRPAFPKNRSIASLEVVAYRGLCCHALVVAAALPAAAADARGGTPGVGGARIAHVRLYATAVLAGRGSSAVSVVLARLT